MNTIRRFRKYRRYKTRKRKGGDRNDILEIVEAEHEVLPFLIKKYDMAQLLDRLKTNILYPYFNNLYNRGISFDTHISPEAYEGYSDVYLIDDMFLGKNNYYKRLMRSVISEYVYILDEDNIYMGGVWTFYRKGYPFLGMYGIRSSLYSFLQRKKGVANKILDRVLSLARSLGLKTIIVPWPRDAMRIILERRGFIETTDIDYDSDEMQFMKPIEIPTSYYFYSIDNNK